jgi:hypothetical protein
MSTSGLYRTAASFIRHQFDDITELDLPKTFGKRRYRKLKHYIDKFNDRQIELVRMMKQEIDEHSKTMNHEQ